MSSTELVKVNSEQWVIARAFKDPAELAESIRHIAGSQTLDQRDLPRAQIAPGGINVWKMSGATGDEGVVQSLEGVVIHSTDTRRYWESQMGEGETSNTPPDCFSVDGMVGQGTVAEGLEKPLCELCPLSDMGSKGDGTRRAACQLRKIVMLIRQDQVLPTIVDLPTMSHRPYLRHLVALLSGFKKEWHVVTRFGLDDTVNQSGQPYSFVVPSTIRNLEPDEMAFMEKVREGMLPALSRVAEPVAANKNGASEQAVQ